MTGSPALGYDLLIAKTGAGGYTPRRLVAPGGDAVARMVDRRKQTSFPRPWRRPTEDGFTLVELLVVMFIVGLVALTAAPYLRQGIKSSQSNTAARTLYTDLALARSLAVKTGFPHLVEFCGGVSVDGSGTFTAVPGYMVIECSSGTPPVADFGASQCLSTSVCAELSNDTPSGLATVRREVNLLKGGYEAESGANSAVKAISGVTFGVVGSGMVATGSAPSEPAIPADGIDLACPTSGAAERRFFFTKDGQAVSDDGSRSPCSGALYITSNLEKSKGGVSPTYDTSLNRAVEFSAAGGLHVYKWDTSQNGWR